MSTARIIGDANWRASMVIDGALLTEEAQARLCEAERLPVSDGSIDVALVNGIFNLNPARAEIFRELARVVRPGGAVFAAELILHEPLPPTTRFSEADWFA